MTSTDPPNSSTSMLNEPMMMNLIELGLGVILGFIVNFIGLIEDDFSKLITTLILGTIYIVLYFYTRKPKRIDISPRAAFIISFLLVFGIMLSSIIGNLDTQQVGALLLLLPAIWLGRSIPGNFGLAKALLISVPVIFAGATMSFGVTGVISGDLTTSLELINNCPEDIALAPNIASICGYDMIPGDSGRITLNNKPIPHGEYYVERYGNTIKISRGPFYCELPISPSTQIRLNGQSIETGSSTIYLQQGKNTIVISC